MMTRGYHITKVMKTKVVSDLDEAVDFMHAKLLDEERDGWAHNREVKLLDQHGTAARLEIVLGKTVFIGDRP